MISIIIPAYNCACCIEKTLDSLLAQTYQEFEIIVVNDGSTDQTDNVIRQYVDAHQEVKILYKATENGGPGTARNHGLSMAQGDYVVFVDADDIVCPVYLETLYNGITDNVEFCFGSYHRIIDDNSDNPIPMISELYGTHPAEKIFVSFFANKTYISLWNSVFLNTIIQNNNLRFTDGCYSGEDVEFIGKYLMCCTRVKSLKDIIYTFYFDSTRAIERAAKYTKERAQDTIYWSLMEEAEKNGWDEGKKALESGKLALHSILRIIYYAKVCDNYVAFRQKAASVKADYDYAKKLKKKYLKSSVYYKACLAAMLFCVSPKLFYGLLNRKNR